MDARRNALLADMARDADIERSDFLVRAGQQLEGFMRQHAARIQQLGGLVLIDDDPDYLAVAPDGTFRSRSRVFDEVRNEWISETEIVETAAELCEIYNPADILQAFADAEAAGVGAGGAGGPGEGDEAALEGGAGGADPYAAAADQWAAGQPEVPEVDDADSAAVALYELALDFQDRSQRTEAGLIAAYENAAAGLLSFIGSVTIVDDDDEHLSLSGVGFRGRVVQEGSPDWQDISSPDAIVRFYDPTDVFGDLAEALVDAYPSVAEAADGDGAAAESEEPDEDDDEHDEDDDEFDDEGDESESDKR
ncbi:MAG TPA: hypothetical protein VJ850_01540 [Candidatus Limnocylindrales bacterium]|nr:hypothetical protein [Candidatus Limnocylindrales bacterium]